MRFANPTQQQVCTLADPTSSACNGPFPLLDSPNQKGPGLARRRRRFDSRGMKDGQIGRGD
jgi:hypothetical protein